MITAPQTFLGAPVMSKKPIRVEFDHKRTKFTVKLNYEWLLLSENTKAKIIEYFRCCIDTRDPQFLNGKLVAKEPINA